MTRPPDDTCARIASRHLGLITRAQASAAGLTARQIEMRVRTGRWERVAWGVYRVAGAPPTWEQDALAACLAAGRDAYLSHEAAGRVWRAPHTERAGVEVLTLRTSSARRVDPSVRVHRPRHLAKGDRTKVGALPVTSPIKTLLDLASVFDAERLEDVVDDFCCRNLVRPEAVQRRLDALGHRRIAGRTHLVELLKVWDGAEDVGSGWETKLVRRLVDRGLPMPTMQVEVRRNGKFVGRADSGWGDWEIALEFDSYTHHSTPRDVMNDRLKRNELQALGWDVFAATAAMVRSAPMLDTLAEQILDAAEARGCFVPMG